MRKSQVVLGGLALFVCAALIWWFARPPDRPNVLVVTIDTLRADALGAESMPALSGLAARGTRFSRARTPVPLTLPAHVSLFTGREPPAHGIRDNTAPPLPERSARSYPLLAEEFRDAGYATAAFVAADVMDPRYRLDAGFSEYRHPPRPPPGSPAFASLSGEEQVERFSRWLRARPKDAPFFAWVHLWEPHAPYRVWAGDERRAGTAEGDPAGELYRGETSRADAALDALLMLVDPEDTIVIVTSDHGESLGEHGEKTHGHLCYATTMDIPLVVAGPDVPTGREDRLCSLVDVAPTLRRLCGLDRARTDGFDLFRLPEDRVLCGESLYAFRLYGWAQQSVAYDGRHALLDGGPRLELYDRSSDPRERVPAGEPTRHERYEPLDRALNEYRGRRGASGGGAELSAAASPYGAIRIAESHFLPPAENRRRKDIAENWAAIDLLNRTQAAIAARSAGPLRQLLEPLRALERSDPANPAPALARGRALLLVLNDPAGAVAALSEAVARGYDHEDVRRLLAEAKRRSRGG